MDKSVKNDVKIKKESVDNKDEDLLIFPFKVYYHNVQSIQSANDKSRAFLKNSNYCDYDIICLTETHLYNEIPSKQFIDLNKYKVYRNELQQHKHGGVLIACKHEIEVIECKASSVYQQIWLTIKYNQRILNLCCVYIPTAKDFEKIMELYLSHFRGMIKEMENQEILIVGDFNFNLAFIGRKTKSPNAIEFQSILDAYKLSQMFKDTNNKGNLLDSVITNMKNLNVGKADEILSKINKDHIPICVQSNIKIKKTDIPAAVVKEFKVCNINLHNKQLFIKWILKKYEDTFPYAFIFFTNVIWDKIDNTEREIKINGHKYTDIWYKDNNLLLINQNFILPYDTQFNINKSKISNDFYIKLKGNNLKINLCFINRHSNDTNNIMYEHLKNLHAFYKNEKKINKNINVIIGSYKSKVKKNKNQIIFPAIKKLNLNDLTDDRSRSNVFSNKDLTVTCNDLINIIDIEMESV